MSLLATAAAMGPATIATFMGASLLLNLTPGADVMFISASGAAGGPKTGIAAALGVSIGSLFHTLIAALGVAALIAANPTAFEALKWAGAGYLAYLAITTWRARPPDASTPSTGRTRAFARGALTNILNPKVSVFILAFLPQFTDPAAGPAWHQIAILGTLFSLGSIPVNTAYGALAGSLAARLRRAGRTMNRIASLVFLTLAARLALSP